MPMKRRIARKRHFPGLSCLLPSRLSSSNRDRLDGDAALKALARLRRDFTQPELASLCGTSIAVVRSWENRRRALRGTSGMIVRIVEEVINDWTKQPLHRDDWREKVWGFPITNIITRRLGEAEQEAQAEEKTFEDQFARSNPDQMRRTILRTKNLLNWMEEVAGIKREEEGNRSNSIVAIESANDDDTIGEKACLADSN